MRRILKPLSPIYRTVVQVNNALFDLGVRAEVLVTSKVISVGNLSVGGSGKTPFSIWLSEEIDKMGLTTAIVGRGYGVNVEKIEEVLGDDYNRYGDEAILMKRYAKGARVFVGPQKSETAKFVSESGYAKVIVVDDGFQHRRLHRDLDIVLVDTTLPPSKFQLLPAGDLREPISNLSRADIVVMTKCNYSENLEWYENRLKPYCELLLKSDFKVSLPKGRAFPGSESVLAVSGIGNPDQFEASIKSVLSPKKIRSLRFKDHHEFTEIDLAMIERVRSQMGGALVVTTQKDLARLKSIPNGWIALDAEISWSSDQYNKIMKILRSRLMDGLPSKSLQDS